MNRVLGALSALALIGPVMAATVRPGGDPSCDRIIWADPFDFYTQWAYNNRDNPAYTRGTTWQGGPIPGATDCTQAYPTLVAPSVPPNCADTAWEAPSNDLARANWVTDNSSTIISPRGVSADPGTFDVLYGGGDPRDTTCYGAGQTSTTLFMSAQANYSWGVGGSYASMSQFTYDLSDRIQKVATARGLGTVNSVNGTDEHPLTLVFYIRSGAWNNNVSIFNNSYVELSLDNDTAPTDYIWRGNYVAPPRGTTDPEYCPNGPYPILCQQARETNSSVSEDGSDLAYLNTNCPALVPAYDPATGAGKTWKSIAFGMLAIIDKDPCGQAEQGVDAHKPTADHMSVFDGNKWRQIRNSRFEGLASGYNTWPYELNMQKGGISTDMLANGGDTRVYLKITTNYILIYAQSFSDVSGQMVATDNYAAVPRLYKGGFNKIRWGVGPGCELDKATGECKAGTSRQSLTYSSVAEGYNRTQMDSMSLIDGEMQYIDTIHGACCNRKDGTCSVTDQVTCEANPNSRWDGVGIACGEIQCCPSQYGDADVDGDVDMVDFAALQKCLTQTGAVNSSDAKCACLDSDGDGDVDSDDIIHFSTCASGAGVAANPACRNW